jgi:hypothetical protein
MHVTNNHRAYDLSIENEQYCSEDRPAKAKPAGKC